MTLLTGVPSEAMACRLALVLAIDVSKSVDSEDYKLQIQGLANAFRDEGVRAAMLFDGAPVAATAFEWSGTGHQAVIVDWLLFTRPNDIDRFAEYLEDHRRTDLGERTAIGSALVLSVIKINGTAEPVL